MARAGGFGGELGPLELNEGEILELCEENMGVDWVLDPGMEFDRDCWDWIEDGAWLPSESGGGGPFGYGCASRRMGSGGAVELG